MKTNVLMLMFALGLLSVTATWSQTQPTVIRVPLIGEIAPSFTAESTNGTIIFPDDYAGKWKVLFSHPADFTPVCSSEILELASDYDAFKKLNTQLVVVSTDNLERHINWKKSLELLNYNGEGQQQIKFPIVDDQSKVIASAYGMIHQHTASSKDVRGVFIIDPSNVIRALFFYPVTTGRNMNEIMRTVEALQVSDKQMVLTPANWEPGKDVMLTGGAVGAQTTNKDPNVSELTWYMMYKKLDK